MITIVSDTSAIRQQVFDWRKSGLTTALVPTMGGLHAGHLALMDTARLAADKVIVSIYVNPTQFAPSEDFEKYPRQLDTDIALIGDRADAVFAPINLYAEDHTTTISPAGPAVGLEADNRPHFFAGVATIVLKLFNQMPVDKAVFGEKDFQQLAVIQKMVADLDLPIDVINHPTVRDEDGLALSSRNRYLTDSERSVAKGLYQTLSDCAAMLQQGMPVNRCLASSKEQLLSGGFSSVDYLSLCNRVTLAPLDHLTGKDRLLVAAYLGDVRLIDNIEVEM